MGTGAVGALHIPYNRVRNKTGGQVMGSFSVEELHDVASYIGKEILPLH